MSEEKTRKKIIERCLKRTKFSAAEMEKLMRAYESTVEEYGQCVDRMTRKLFQQFLHTHFNMTDRVLMDQIFKYFNEDHDTEITREEWLLGFSVFLKGTEEEQTEYCFKIYDINSDGFITREEMMTLMKSCLVRQGTAEDDGDGDEGVKDLIEITLRRMDHDRDGRVSFDDFRMTVLQEPLLMEAFGECLPYNKAGFDFMHRFLDIMPGNRIYCL